MLSCFSIFRPLLALFLPSSCPLLALFFAFVSPASWASNVRTSLCHRHHLPQLLGSSSSRIVGNGSALVSMLARCPLQLLCPVTHFWRRSFISDSTVSSVGVCGDAMIAGGAIYRSGGGVCLFSSAGTRGLESFASSLKRCRRRESHHRLAEKIWEYVVPVSEMKNKNKSEKRERESYCFRRSWGSRVVNRGGRGYSLDEGDRKTKEAATRPPRSVGKMPGESI